MASLQSTSLKISKEPKNNYMCGACSKILKSYPALFQHIKLRHQGIRPPHTKVVKQAPPSNSKPLRNINSRSSGLYTQPMISTPTSQQVQPSFVGTAQTGRPSKPLHNIDDLSYAELCIEETQNELLGFLGERLMVISGFEDKLKLEDAIERIQLPKEKTDKWFSDVQNECQVLYRQYGEDINLDFEEEFKNLNPDNGLGILVWFLLWLGKHFVKREFILDLAIVISKIWKVLESTQLQVQDLDNKLVWKKAMAECKIVVDDLPFFRRDEELIYEFIQKLCQLIGKAFEQLG